MFLPGGIDWGKLHEQNTDVAPAPITTEVAWPVVQLVYPTVVELASLFCTEYSLHAQGVDDGVGVTVLVGVGVGVVVIVGVTLGLGGGRGQYNDIVITLPLNPVPRLV